MRFHAYGLVWVSVARHHEHHGRSSRGRTGDPKADAAVLRDLDADFAREERAKSLGDALAAVTGEFNAYFDALLADRRVYPRDDLLAVIANATIDGAPIPQHEARSYSAHIATAGHDTTSGTTSGGVLALCRNPEMFSPSRQTGAWYRPGRGSDALLHAIANTDAYGSTRYSAIRPRFPRGRLDCDGMGLRQPRRKSHRGSTHVSHRP